MKRRVLIVVLLLAAWSLFPSIGHGSDDPRADSPLHDPRHSFWSESAPNVFRAEFQTTKGNFVIEAHRAWAPRGVDRFYNLVRGRFFDDSRFFRVRAGFIAQFGIAGDPAIATRWMSETMEDDPVQQRNTRGFVSYAMTGPNGRTTQLFINLGDNSRLDGDGFAPIARVVEGMDVVDALYAEYGEDAGGGMRGGKQQPLFTEGNAYLDGKFPKLDRIIQATIVTSK